MGTGSDELRKLEYASPQLYYSYRPRWRTMILAGGLFVACGLVLVEMAESNDRGLIIEHVIELSPRHATDFYWVMAVLSFTFVATAALMMVVAMYNPQAVELCDEG